MQSFASQHVELHAFLLTYRPSLIVRYLCHRSGSERATLLAFVTRPP